VSGRLKVLFVTPECSPFAKTGGLGDVVGALPKALARRGVDARVVMPLYAGMSWDKLDRLDGALAPSVHLDHLPRHRLLALGQAVAVDHRQAVAAWLGGAHGPSLVRAAQWRIVITSPSRTT